MSSGRISVLVVDDSAFIQKAKKRMLGSDPMIRVLGEARDGIEALEKVKKLKPDVVTLDVKMPDMGGLEALEQIMRENPVPVLMVSSLTSEGGEITLRALELGPMSLDNVLTSLPVDYPGAILVVQHMPVGFTGSLAERMNRQFS